MKRLRPELQALPVEVRHLINLTGYKFYVLY
jgi:hypothetical protein